MRSVQTLSVMAVIAGLNGWLLACNGTEHVHDAITGAPGAGAGAPGLAAGTAASVAGGGSGVSGSSAGRRRFVGRG